jgi:hypothetical protein
MRTIMANDQHRGGTGGARANGRTDQHAGLFGVGNISLGNFDGGAHEDGEDDYRHRMKMNVLGFLVATLLVISGTWIVDTMAEVRRIQDCLLAGGRNCVPIRRTGENIRQSSDLTGSATTHWNSYGKLFPRTRKDGDFSEPSSSAWKAMHVANEIKGS